MEVKRNGRYTAHEVTLEVPKPPEFQNKATEGKMWIFRVVISYQYLWSDGAWHVIHVKLIGRRSATARNGNMVAVKMTKTENWPAWIHEHVIANTPAVLSKPETLK